MKRIKLSFKLEHGFIPKNYNSMLLSFIKKSLQNYNEDFYQSIFRDTQMKSYTFSCFLPNPKFEADKIVLSGNSFDMWFSTYKAQDAMLYYNAFIKMRGKKNDISGNSFVLQQITAINVNDVNDNKIIIQMESPIIARQHNKDDNTDKFLTFDDADFNCTLKQTIKLTTARNGLNIHSDNFKITPVAPKKTVINYYDLKINANIGIYQLEGDKELLQFLLGNGIGSSSSSGHGKFKIINI